MIIRKPYAFLIKNFRKIHIFLLILSFYVFYKLIDVSSFVNEFMRYGTYDLFRNPVSKHITTFLTLSIFILFIGSLSLLFLLRHKNKPWKVYLIPTIEYFVLFLVLGMIKSFFRGYSADIETTDLRMSRDLLMIFLIAQLPAIGIYLMRIFGWDIKKFNFNSDQEFLELSEEDREEVEIGLSIDKNTFIRGYKRFLRNASYVYLEHKKICNAIIGVIALIIGFSVYNFVFVTNRSYKQGDYYFVDGYTFKINKTYFTDKDYNGNVISNNSNFVILDLSIRNSSAPRKIYLENFHLKSRNKDFVTTRKTYSKEFQDLGSSYESTRELKRDETLDCIIVYKVDKNLNKNRFVLYYQENGGHLRKIKLNVKDISNISEPVNKKLGDTIDLGFRNKSDIISFDDILVVEESEYTARKCTTSGCHFDRREITINGEDRLLEIEFASEVWEAKNMIDFLKNYGKIIYKDSEGGEHTLEVDNPIKDIYYGKKVLLRVPVELENAKEISFDLLIRDKHYIYKLN